jgi:hypothetical protein
MISIQFNHGGQDYTVKVPAKEVMITTDDGQVTNIQQLVDKVHNLGEALRSVEEENFQLYKRLADMNDKV